MGIIIALTIMLIWAVHLVYSLLYVNLNMIDPLFYLHIFVQAYLYTGLFITGHDAMHRNIAQSTKINYTIGVVSSFLFAGLSTAYLCLQHIYLREIAFTQIISHSQVFESLIEVKRIKTFIKKIFFIQIITS